ncbi:MAG: acyltransferase [Tunicatimonas sp.]
MTIAKQSDKKSYIYSLQLLRIIAAFFVMLFHINSIFVEKYNIHPILSYVNFGQSGVHIFFVLSGFVMYLMHRDDIGNGLKKANIFATKRFIRIYPTYWVLTSLVLVSMFLTSGEVKAYKYSFSYIFESYSLFHLGLMEGNPLIPAGWTLFHEVKFYSFFLLLIALKDIKIRNFVIWVALTITVINIFIDTAAYPVFTFYFSSFNLLFAMGVVSGWITDHYARQVGNLANVIFAIFAFAGVSVISNYLLWDTDPTSIIIFGIVSFLIITSLSCYEQTRQSSFRFSSTILMLANITYCLYLIHYPVYTIITIIDRKLNLPYSLVVIAMIFVSFVASIIYYKLIEEPLVNVLKRKLLKSKKNTIRTEVFTN